MSSSEQITIPCPQCHRPVPADIWKALDLAKNPELRQQVLQGQLQHLHCPHCQALALPFAVHDPVGQQVIFYIPENLPLPPEIIPHIQEQLGNALMLTMEGPPPEYILNHTVCRDAEELKELLRERASEASPNPETDRLTEFSRMLEDVTPDQRQTLLSIMQTATDEESLIRSLSKHPDLLAALQSVGQEFADEAISLDLQNILDELDQPVRIPDMPRRVQLCRKALNLLSRQQDPQLWAALQKEFGDSLQQSLLGERAENLEQAIATYQQALEVRARTALPVEWAETMQNLGNAYLYRIRGERAENLEQAIDAYNQALTVLTLVHFPGNFLNIHKALGSVYFDKQRWNEAHAAFAHAIEAGQMLLETAYTEAGRQAEVEETSRLYARASYCLLHLAQYGAALHQLEQGKTRLLAEVLALSGADVTPAQQQSIFAARETIRSLEAEMRLPPDTPARRNDREIAEELRQARGEVKHTIESIREEHPEFMPTGLNLPDILALIPEGGVLIAPVVTSQGSAVFVLPHGVKTVGAEHVFPLDSLTENTLNTLLVGTAENPG